MQKISFSDLNERLLVVAKMRIRNGLVTERGLARSIGVSQPHLHNVLKGARALTNDTADRLLLGLQIGVADLLSATERRTTAEP